MYYVSLLWWWHPVMILVRTGHSCLRVGCHTKRQAWDRYGWFSPPSRHEVGSTSHHCIASPPSRQEEASSDDSVQMWVVDPPPPLRLQVATPPPPLTRLVAPPPPPPSTRVDDSSSDSSGYNDECTHVKEVSSYELLHFNCLVQLLNVHVYF
jgi:hypothetical protein